MLDYSRCTTASPVLATVFVNIAIFSRTSFRTFTLVPDLAAAMPFSSSPGQCRRQLTFHDHCCSLRVFFHFSSSKAPLSSSIRRLLINDNF
ncbi:hypothetical protein KCP69_16910 [Salmonella enterica subsp. enterica]|nr:hypothetical protein KCP69_16910 [Salmonella enterica subsp. enterica]